MSQQQNLQPDPPQNPAPPESQQQQPPANHPATGQGEEVFTKADLEAAIQKARQQEKDKVYGRVENLQQQLTEISEREKARQQAEDEARKKAETEAKQREEEELSAKELLERREKEWQERLNTTQQTFEERLAQMQREREEERAVLEKERKFNELQQYRASRLAQENDNIAPELTDFISGNTPEEIDAAIEKAKEKSLSIAENARRAAQAARAQQRGTSVTGLAPVGPMEMEGGQKKYSPEDIQNMDMAEYAKLRQSIGIGQGGNNRGMFG